MTQPKLAPCLAFLLSLSLAFVTYVHCYTPDIKQMLQQLERVIHNQAIDDSLTLTSISPPKLILSETTEVPVIGTILSALLVTFTALNAESSTYTLLRKIGGFVTVATRRFLINHIDGYETSTRGFDAQKWNILFDIFCSTAHIASPAFTAYGFIAILDVVLNAVKNAIDAWFNHYEKRRHRRVDIKPPNIPERNASFQEMLNRCIAKTCRLPVKFGGSKNRPFTALIDTGAMMNLITVKICDEFSLSYETVSIPVTVGNGTSLNVVGVVETDMYVEECCDRVLFFVVDQTDQDDEVVLGMRFFNDTKMCLHHTHDESIMADFNFGRLKVVATVGDSRLFVRNEQPQELKIVVHREEL